MIWIALSATAMHVLMTTIVLATPEVASPRRSVVCHLVSTVAVALCWISTYGYYYMRVPA